MVLPQHHVICDRTAAWIHGIDTYDLPGQASSLRLETVALRGRTRTRRDGCIGAVRDLAPDDVVVVGGVMVTTPVRTALDLSCKLKPMSALAAVEAYLHAEVVTKEQLLAQLPRYKGRRGIRLARQVVELADSRVESTGESFTRMVIYRSGLPMPESQVWVFRDEGHDIRLDHAYKGLKIAVEYDGEEFHGADRREADDARREWLRNHGWYVIVVRKHQLSGVNAQAWIDELRGEIIERSRSAERYSRFARW
ncbi:hypothetical protein [Leekyejoonella antrihumi]|uniref:DUF559 domain-containing protein n=1 Tax=Leekyejoonella antrihumi TaxID=1660198 RepID=A0A563E355_9MICO|nr:hypothetical protein [Leekyejoonella antrihumi]TWP36683.1 hypothetical protein FGL98_09525 [Leekyejoonella antrihumi]